MKIEGYWYSETEPQRTFPESNVDEWESQDRFLEYLIRLEDNLLHRYNKAM